MATPLLIILLSPFVFANVALPTILVSYSLMIRTLIVIILIESAILSAFIHKPFKYTLIPVSKANIISTIFGLPLSWLLLALKQIHFFRQCGPGFDTLKNGIITAFIETAFLCPAEGNGSNFVMAVTGIIIVILNFAVALLMSVFIEYYIISKTLSKENIDKKTIKKSVWIGNIITYIMLILLTILIAVLHASNNDDFLDYIFNSKYIVLGLTILYLAIYAIIKIIFKNKQKSLIDE